MSAAPPTEKKSTTATISTGRVTGTYEPGSIKFKKGVWKSDTFGCWADSTTTVHAKTTTLKAGDHVLACMIVVPGVTQVGPVRQVANDPDVTCSVDMRKFAK